MNAEDQPRVIVVDDDPAMCRVLAVVLAAPGRTIATALTGSEALALLEVSGCDVAVVDYRLPDMDGLDLFRKMRTRQPALEAILITSYGTPELEARATAAGVFSYRPKPFYNEVIVALVDAALGQVRRGGDSPGAAAASGTRLPESGRSL